MALDPLDAALQVDYGLIRRDAGQSVESAISLLFSRLAELQATEGRPMISQDNISGLMETIQWVPVIGGSGGTSGQTYLQQYGRAWKFGRFVCAVFSAILTAKGTITGTVQLQNLPYRTWGMNLGHFDVCSPRFANLAATKVNVTIQTLPGTTAAAIRGIGAAAISNDTDLVTADIGNDTEFRGTLLYLSAY